MSATPVPRRGSGSQPEPTTSAGDVETGRPRPGAEGPSGTGGVDGGRDRRDDDGPGWRADDVPGALGGVMAALRFATRLVEVNLLVALGSLAGGILLGLGPALRAGSAVLGDAELAMEPWRGFWREWRAGWRRSNLLFAPFWPVAALLTADAVVVGQMTGALYAVLAGGLTLAGAWTTVVLAWWPRIALRYDDPAPAVWRYLLLTPLTAPGTAVAILVTVVATVTVVLGAPVTALLAGVSFPLWATSRLVGARLDGGTPRP